MSEQGKPGPDFSGSGPVEFDPGNAETASSVDQLMQSAEPQLLAIPGVVSVGIAFGGPDGQVFAVGVTDAGVIPHVPREIQGVPVIVTVTGEIDAQGPN